MNFSFRSASRRLKIIDRFAIEIKKHPQKCNPSNSGANMIATSTTTHQIHASRTYRFKFRIHSRNLKWKNDYSDSQKKSSKSLRIRKTTMWKKILERRRFPNVDRTGWLTIGEVNFYIDKTVCAAKCQHIADFTRPFGREFYLVASLAGVHIGGEKVLQIDRPIRRLLSLIA